MRGYFFRHILFAAVLLVPLLVFALAKSIDTAGVWSDTGIWVGGVPGTTSDDVNMINNTGEVIVASDVTVKTMDMGNGNTMTINTGVTFTADNGGLDAFFITNNNTVLNIFGDLIINGNLIINNNLILTVNITGSLIINGDVTINNGGSLDVAGTMDVSGDMTAGTNTSLDVDGSLTIDGTLDTGTGSVVTGSGTVDAGICTGDPAVCNDSQLPIILLYFNATVDEAKRAVKLDWASYEEVNF
ncbi:MAG: hypothetical protein OEX02_12150, partial [Cyclobacteriaceae bacterium]|nr:hypothetical protein [Cyclobacteriaceae bacterium]